MLCFPHAKINLGLRIVGKREDGFHDLETCFYPVQDLCDGLEMLEAEHSDLFVYGMPWTENRESNLVWKAMELFRKEEPSLPPLEWHIQKRIPAGAGLGGGSSDATFALRMMAKLAGWNEQDVRLYKMAAHLGSDCAFFLQDAPMLGFGRGEILKAIPLDLSSYDVRFIFPGIHISTAKAFSGIQISKPEISLADILSQPVETWKDVLKNDFEDSLFPQFPELKAAKEKLYAEGAIYASMSGSGSTVFGIFAK
jgi:4-diphosphocytidyl-2-C-methyl-D-erythritol kinase